MAIAVACEVRGDETPGMRACLLVVAAAHTMLACINPGSASYQFSAATSCPESRLRLTELPPPPPAPVPSDIASDPERLAIWRTTHAREEQAKRYEVVGCGQHGTYSCHPSERNGLDFCVSVEPATPASP